MYNLKKVMESGKKSDYEILTYLYVFRYPESIYAISKAMTVYICAYVRAYDSIVHSIELKFGMYIIGHHSTYCVNFGKFRIALLQEYKKELLYITAYGVKL